MPRQRNRRCTCGHDRSLHTFTANSESPWRSPCEGQGFNLTEGGSRAVCACERFTTPAEVRARKASERFESLLAQARRELSEALARTSMQEAKDE